MQQVVNGTDLAVLPMMIKPAGPDRNVRFCGIPNQLIVPLQRLTAAEIRICDVGPFFAKGGIVRLLRMLFNGLGIICTPRHDVPFR